MKKIRKTCVKCKSELFTIEERYECGGCEHNGAMTESGEYIYEESVIKALGLDRDEVWEDSSCRVGEAFYMGCYLFRCSYCGHVSNLAHGSNLALTPGE